MYIMCIPINIYDVYTSDTNIQNKVKHFFEDVHPCFNYPCENDGTCTASGDGFECTCASNYGGNTCQFGI